MVTRASQVAAQLGFERGRLPAGEFEDRGTATDLRVMVRHLFGARRRDQLRQRLAGDPGEGKIDDIRIAEKIVEKGLNRLERIRSPQLKQNNSNFA